MPSQSVARSVSLGSIFDLSSPIQGIREPLAEKSTLLKNSVVPASNEFHAQPVQRWLFARLIPIDAKP
jgi:hypothetical protein